MVTSEITGRVSGLLVVCAEQGIATHISMLSTNNTQLDIPIKDTPHDEEWWRNCIGRKVKIVKSVKVELVGQTAADACPDKIDKYLIQVTRTLPYTRALTHAKTIKNCKLWKVTPDKYIVIRKVEPGDNVYIIDLSDGDWQDELIDVHKGEQANE